MPNQTKQLKHFYGRFKDLWPCLFTTKLSCSSEVTSTSLLCLVFIVLVYKFGYMSELIILTSLNANGFMIRKIR